MYVEELARAIKQAGEQYLLIYDAAAEPGYEGRSYDYHGLNKAGIDFFFVMDYDLNDYDDPAPWNDHSMANSPAPVVAQGLQKLMKFIPERKLVVGLPFYGYEYIGFLGKTPIVSRQLGLGEISSILRDPSWTHHFDNKSLTPYLKHGNGLAMKQMWYDDPISLAEKLALQRSSVLFIQDVGRGTHWITAMMPQFLLPSFWNALTITK